MKGKKRIPTDGRPPAWTSPFDALKELNLQTTRVPLPEADHQDVSHPAPKKNRGRVDILRQTAHRGGKTVTVVANFVGVSEGEKAQLAREMQKACGAGGTVKDGRIEIQGDHREIVVRMLTEAGFRPVRSGG